MTDVTSAYRQFQGR